MVDWPKKPIFDPDNQGEDDQPHEIFNALADGVLEDGTARRLERMFEVNERSIQYWRQGKKTVPSDVIRTLAEQSQLQSKLGTRAKLEALVDGWLDAGLHKEVVASELAVLYVKLAGTKIR
jgi:hypothetical protein